MRLIGMILMIGAGSAIGFYKAYELRRRIRDLILLQNLFRLLETEIHYTHNPVPAALKSIAPQLPTVQQQFCRETCRLMETECLTLSEAWQQAAMQLHSSSYLCRREMEAVCSFGQSLGMGDVGEQLKHFQLLQQRLQAALDEAECTCTQKERIWQYMGVCLSMAAVLLLY